MHRLDFGLFSHSKEFWGNGARTHVYSKRKIPSSGKKKFFPEEERTHDAASSRAVSPKHYQRAIPAPQRNQHLSHWYNSTVQSRKAIPVSPAIKADASPPGYGLSLSFCFSFSSRWQHSAREGPNALCPRLSAVPPGLPSKQLNICLVEHRSFPTSEGGNVGRFLSQLLCPSGDQCYDALVYPCSESSSSL